MGSRMRFAIIGAGCAAILHLFLHMCYGGIVLHMPLGRLRELWVWDFRYAELWLMIATVLLFRPPPWVTALIATLLATVKNVGLGILPRLEEAQTHRFIVSQWYFARPILLASFLVASTTWLSAVGRRRDWQVDSLLEVKEWFVRERHKE